MTAPVFQLLVLGCTGGPRENNLSGYLLAPLAKQEWIALDAGSLLAGVDLALEKKHFEGVDLEDPELTPAGVLLLKRVKAYLISHAHLDHIAGLVINSQNDEGKTIAGINPTIDNLRDHIFNGRIWPNYGSEGLEPILNRYTYLRLPLHQPTPIPKTSFIAEAFLLSHPRGYPSSAFLIEYDSQAILYFGDTSSDFMESEKHLTRIWNRIAPLLKEKRLHAILLECSYHHKAAGQVIFGHLDTALLIRELHHLAEIVGSPIKGLKVIVTHRKEHLKKGKDAKEIIKDELLALNDLGIDFIFPCQGDRYLL